MIPLYFGCLKSAGPCFSRGHQAGKKVVLSHKSEVSSSKRSQVFLSNLYLTGLQSPVWCLQVYRSAKLVTGGLIDSCYCTPWCINLPPTRLVLSTWGGPENQWNFNEFPIPKKSLKLLPKTSKSHQNDVQTGTWNHQIHEKVKKVKSNENMTIYYTFEGLGHQNSPEFPFKNQQKTWLQSKCHFGLFKSEKIWKSAPEGSPMGDPKSIKNHWKSILVPSECTLAPNDHQNTEKVVSPDPECLKNGPPRPQKINKSVEQN